MKDLKSPYVEKKLNTVYNPVVEHQDNDIAEILRIVQEEDLTRIDFVYQPSRKYINGGWVCMEREAFIRPVNTNQRLTMVQAVNIPIAPKKHWFKCHGQSLYYTLYFPALPGDVTAIDIIEREVARPHDYFNFYGVSLEKIALDIISVPN